MLFTAGGGYNLIRTGGTYVEADSDEVPTDPEDTGRNGFLWKKQRGPPWLRPGGNIENHDGMNGVMTTRGWSMFEAIAMCEAMQITPVITLKSTETLEDLGDLVEYLYGNHTSGWGKMRAEDGHPEPYNISWFEIGNEIDTQDFAGRAMAMEARAQSIGQGGILRYACPANCGDDAVINASFAGNPALGERVYVDVHDGGRGSLEAARGHVSNFVAKGSKARVVVWETNTARHDFSRVVAEASDLNDLQREGWLEDARVDSRVESFCMEKSAHDPCLDAEHGFCGDQGAVFFTPNATWAQPPWYVHKMILDAAPWADELVAVHVDGMINTTHPGCANCWAFPCCGLNVLAAKASEGDTLVLRIVNAGTVAINVTLAFPAGHRVPASFVRTSFASTTGTAEGPDTDNPIWEPERHAPIVSAPVPFAGSILTVPPVSFEIYVFTMG